MRLDLLTPEIQAERIARDAGIATAAAHADRKSAGCHMAPKSIWKRK